MADLGIANQSIQDDIEYYRTRRFGHVSERWDLDQHDIDIPSLTVQVFTMNEGDSLLHPVSGTIVAGYFADVLDGYPKIRLTGGDTQVAGFEAAFRTARTSNADFFIILGFSESERTFRARARLYLARTGTLLADYSVERTGNDRIRDSLLRLGSNVNELLPIRGVLLEKRFDRGVIDLGLLHGLKEKDTLLIVKAGKVALRTDKVGFALQDADVVGKITLDAVDEAVAEGVLEKKSFYDYISVGDEVVILTDEETQKRFQEKETATTSRLLEELVDLK